MKALFALPRISRSCADLGRQLPHKLQLDFYGASFEIAATSSSAIAYLGGVYEYFRIGDNRPAAAHLVLIEEGTAEHAALSSALEPGQTGRAFDGHFLLADWFPWGIRVKGRMLLHYYASKMLRLGVVDCMNSDLMTLHAASLSGRNCGILLIGEAACGKTSLTLELLRCGFRYCADDTSCIRRDNLHCVPFPMPLTVRADLETGLPNLAKLASVEPHLSLLDEPRWLVECWDAVAEAFMPTHLFFLGVNGLEPGEFRELSGGAATVSLLHNVVCPIGANLDNPKAMELDFDLACRLADRTICLEGNAADLPATLSRVLQLARVS